MSGSGGGIYGMGRAFNLKYRPNGPLKTFIYDRRMPMFGFGPRRPHYGGGFDLMSTNVTYEYNRGFWGNLADIFTGLAAGFGIFSQIRGMFSSNSDIVQGPEESQRKPKPQGAKSDDDAANLKRLQTLAPKMTIISEGDGKFTLLAEDGQYIKKAEYDDAQNWIFNYNKKTEAKTPTEKAKAQERTVEGGDGADGAGASGGAGAAGGAGRSTRSRGASPVGSGKRHVPEGWYPASEDRNGTSEISKLKIEDLKNKGTGAAEHLTELIRQTKGLKLNENEKKLLMEYVIKNNPSIFKQDPADGSVKNGADISKLDIPSMEWIKDNIKTNASNNPKVENKKLSAEEKKQAQINGKKVADNLVGYTTDNEANEVKEIITKKINSRNVKEFLNAYESNKGLGDHFFTQMGRELWHNGEKERNTLAIDVAKKLVEYCKATGQTEQATQIENIIKNGRYPQIDDIIAKIK